MTDEQFKEEQLKLFNQCVQTGNAFSALRLIFTLLLNITVLLKHMKDAK